MNTSDLSRRAILVMSVVALTLVLGHLAVITHDLSASHDPSEQCQTCLSLDRLGDLPVEAKDSLTLGQHKGLVVFHHQQGGQPRSLEALHSRDPPIFPS